MRNRTLKTALLSTAALFAAAATLDVKWSGCCRQMNQTIKSINDAASGKQPAVDPNQLKTKTPIKHLVVIFNENISFDHYFGTYPQALNVEGEPVFTAAKGTQTDINNLRSSPALLDNNPNLNPLNGTGASNPFRLDRTQARPPTRDGLEAEGL
jgi:phospholipase C